jgi:predicted phosphodiesterase
MTILPRSVLALACLILVLPTLCRANVIAAWSQYGGDDRIEARVVTDEAKCPALTADGESHSMRLRSKPIAPEFPYGLCVAAIPAGSKSVTAGGRALPVPVAKPKHIVLLGDTGCRVTDHELQNCLDENQWPFRRVASAAAKSNPDLVIHVGDYYYRENPCPDLSKGCAGPYGDKWETWAAEFFTPGADLLAAAPWVVVRGNHEECRRGGKGWSFLLGRDQDAKGGCTGHEAPLLVDLGGVKLAVLEDSRADPKGAAIPDVAAEMKADLAAIAGKKPDWIVTHHPMRGVSKVPANKPPVGANATMMAAFEGYDESTLTLMLSGHIHNFQIENYAPPHAPQLVVGEGGDNLDEGLPESFTGLAVGGQTITDGLQIPGFGYVTIDRIGDSQDWNITVHKDDGRELRKCWLKAKHLGCKPA